MESDLAEQLGRQFTVQDAMRLMAPDFWSDPAVVEVGTQEIFLGTMMLDKDMVTTSVLAGSQEIEEATYGIRHDYRQARVATAFYNDYVNQSADAFKDDDALLSFMMDVPDFPPYAPVIVNSDGDVRKFEAPQLRQDYNTIMTTLSLVAPPIMVSHVCDNVLSGWTAHPRRVGTELMFIGRSELEEDGEGIGEAYGNYVRLRFNPMTPLGAAMVQRADYNEERTELRGHYEERGKLYPFRYRLGERKTFVVSPDEWIPRLQIQSFSLGAFDLESDRDFWPYRAQMRQLASRAIPIQDRLMPAGYRFIDYDPARKSYHQKTSQKPNTRYVMHAGSSLVHQVRPVSARGVLGEYVALDVVHEHSKGFWVYEMAYDGEPTGIFCHEPDMTGVTTCPWKWRALSRLYVCYREGERNAVKVKLGTKEVYVFRSKQRPMVGRAAYASEIAHVRVRDYPSIGIWTNPQSSMLLFDTTMFELPHVGRPAQLFSTFMLHKGVYTNFTGSVVKEGVDIMTYFLAHRESGRTRALYDMCNNPAWTATRDLADSAANALGGIESMTHEESLDAFYAEMLAAADAEEEAAGE